MSLYPDSISLLSSIRAVCSTQSPITPIIPPCSAIVINSPGGISFPSSSRQRSRASNPRSLPSDNENCGWYTRRKLIFGKSLLQFGKQTVMPAHFCTNFLVVHYQLGYSNAFGAFQTDFCIVQRNRSFFIMEKRGRADTTGECPALHYQFPELFQSINRTFRTQADLRDRQGRKYLPLCGR